MTREAATPRASRRQVLRAVGLGAVTLPVLAACTSEPPAPLPPDPLVDLAAQARVDAAAADAIAKAVPDLAKPAKDITAVRTEHALALQKEADRARPPASGASSSAVAPPPATTAPTDKTVARKQLMDALTAGEKAAAALVPTIERYRAGLLGSVAAGCASLREVLG